jgi:predicted amidohydrolase
MQEFVVAAVQLPVKPLDCEANVARACAGVEKAVREQGAQLVVLPETITTGFHPGPDKSILKKLSDAIPGRLTEAIQRKARELGVHVVWPTYEKGPDNLLFNSAAVVGPDGAILGIYRKTHPFPTEQQWTTRGTEATVVDTPLGKIGLVICYDGDFPELCRAEALKGAELIVRPSALLRDYEVWSLTNRARAYDNQVWFVAVNSVGPDAGGNYYFGHSMIVTPLGTIAALARAGEQIVATRIDPGLAATCMVQHLRDRNPEAYAGVT